MCVQFTFKLVKSLASDRFRIQEPCHKFYIIMSEVWKTYTHQELEDQVSPSRSPAARNKGRTNDEVVQHCVEVCSKLTEKNRQQLVCKLDIPYGDKAAQKYDLYGTDLKDDTPILVWIHGGYWQEGNKIISGHFAHHAHALGIRTVGLGYTLAPEANIKEMQEEMKQALRKLVQLYPSAKLILGGWSAGGHLSAQLLHDDTLDADIAGRIEGLFLISGVFDLRPLVRTYVNDPLKLTADTANELSPLCRPFSKLFPRDTDAKKKPRVVVIYGGSETMEFKRVSITYSEELMKHRFETDIINSEQDDHFTLMEDIADENTVCGHTFVEFLKNFK